MSLGHSLRLAFRRATSLREGGKASILLLYKLQFELHYRSRGPKDVGFASGFVTNCQRRLAADKLQFETEQKTERTGLCAP